MKDIILPWSCKTGDKIKSIIKWILLVSVTLTSIHFLVNLNSLDYKHNSSLLLGEFGFILSVTIIGWTMQLIVWAIRIQPPKFKCKGEDEKS